MKKETLNHLNAINQTIALEDWKAALDSLILTMRKEFVFDNLVVYLTDKQKDIPEVTYARAVGRGRKAEADAAWGENIANQVISAGKILQDSPAIQTSKDRVAMPYLLGLPLFMYRGAGALIFIRFGGPEYTTAQIQMAALAASQVSRILEWRLLRENIAQLEQARHRAQLQDDFMSTVSHDLYTPLGFIKGYATSLLRSDTTWDAETQREFLTIIDEETDHLMTLVDKFLDSARLQSGMMNMDFQPVRLDSLIRDVVLRLKGHDKSLPSRCCAQVDLDLEISPPIQADTVRLAQVFENLFENAFKYAPDSNISITLRNLGDRLTVTFADRGPGITSEHLPFLFERFYRVPAQSGKRGTGLGLFICRQILQAHNGQISVETAPGKGTAFRIDLPVRQHPLAKQVISQ
ncbi:MAG: HAMP domain-containing sensor histidine kinase [Anaerolineales bacterium]|nr:HAMP domain-containing sensor histidine kinase [Anaerolineales bacterium]